MIPISGVNLDVVIFGNDKKQTLLVTTSNVSLSLTAISSD